MDRKTSAWWRAQRLGRAVRVSIFLMAAAAVAATCAAAVPASGGAATAASGKKLKHPLCSSLFSTGEIKQITGLETKMEGKPTPTKGPHSSSWWRASPSGKGNLPGSVCDWLDQNPPGPPWGPDYGLQNTARVVVGYGESKKNWRDYRATTKASGSLDFTLPASYSKVNVGHGSNAFLATVDLWAYYRITPATDQGNFPHYLYAVFVFTKHHNVLEAWFVTASLAKTVGQVQRILKGGF